MAKVVLSARIEADLAGWAKVYAKRRDATVASVVEAALREFREACEGGPGADRGLDYVVVSPATKRASDEHARRAPVRGVMAERQERLRKQMGWDKP